MVLNGLLKSIALLRKIYLWLVLVTIVLLLGLASPVLADDLDNWHWRNPLPQGNGLHSVTYGNNTFVAVGESGTILTSLDGITWISEKSGNAHWLKGVTYGNNTFVAVGDGAILTSSDGITWTSRKLDTEKTWLEGVTYSNNTFVAVGDGGTILTSQDGITWSSRTSGTPNWLTGVTYGNKTFVAVGGDNGSTGTILTSPDGVTWTSRISGTTNDLYGVNYGNNTFVAVGGSWGCTILTSPDGIIWIDRTSGATQNLNGVTYDNNTFIAVGVHGTILTSTDGITWSRRWISGTGTAQELKGVTYGNNTFVAVGSGAILTSPDGISWTSRTSGGRLRGVTYGNNTFVAVGDNIFNSPDGITWSSRTIGTTDYLFGVTFGNNTFVAVGDYGAILTSPEGITWTSRKSGTTNYLWNVTYGNNTFVAVGGDGTILTSPDGITWTSETSGLGKTNLLRGVTYGNNTFVAVGDSGSILTSPNGITWTIRSSGTKEDYTGVTYGNNTFVAVGYIGAILTSPDGIAWTSRESDTEEGFSSVIYGNNTFVAVGYSGGIITSPDGITWTSRTSGMTCYLDGVTYGNNTFVAVGDLGTILQSDTLTQSQLTITTTNLVSGTVGSPYNVTLAANGGTTPYTWSATGLPLGLSINSSSGVISGTPTVAGTSTVTVTVSTVDGSKTATYAVDVSAIAISFPSQKDIPLDKEWRIKFNQPVNSSTIQSNILLWRLDPVTKTKVKVDITPVIDPATSKVVIIEHSTPFVAGTTYELAVNKGVQDLSKRKLSDPVSLTFSTIPSLPTDVTVQSVSAVNGIVTITLNSTPGATPTIEDFVVTQSIGDGTATIVRPTKISTNGAVVKLTVPTVAATGAAQSVVESVKYKGGVAVSASAFIVSPTITIQSVSAVNGIVTITLNSTPGATPVIEDFVVTQSIGDGTATIVRPSEISTNGAVVKLTVPKVAATGATKSVVESVKYKGGTVVSASAFIVGATISIETVSAVNGIVTITLNSTPGATPVIEDFAVTQSIGDAAATIVRPSEISINGAVVKLTIPTVVATSAVQSVVESVKYNGGTAVSASAFIVDPTISVQFTVNTIRDFLNNTIVNVTIKDQYVGSVVGVTVKGTVANKINDSLYRVVLSGPVTVGLDDVKLITSNTSMQVIDTTKSIAVAGLFGDVSARVYLITGAVATSVTANDTAMIYDSANGYYKVSLNNYNTSTKVIKIVATTASGTDSFNLNVGQ